MSPVEVDNLAAAAEEAAASVPFWAQLEACEGAEQVMVPAGEAPAGQTLLANGPQISQGSGNHPERCTPCSFYCFSLKGCLRGGDCCWCHMEHLSRRQRLATGQSEPPSGSASGPLTALTKDGRGRGWLLRKAAKQRDRTKQCGSPAEEELPEPLAVVAESPLGVPALPEEVEIASMGAQAPARSEPLKIAEPAHTLEEDLRQLLTFIQEELEEGRSGHPYTEILEVFQELADVRCRPPCQEVAANLARLAVCL